MALRPPDDFDPPLAAPEPPTEQQLRDLWRRHQAERRRRERGQQWGRVQQVARRDSGGALRPAPGAGSLPAYLHERHAVGPNARAALRPVPGGGGVLAAGVDTWSPCWYAPPGSLLARALDALATETSGRARLLPEPVAGHRVGWFPDPRLVFAEGRAGGEALLSPFEVDVALARLGGAFADLGIAAVPERCAGLRRLDVVVDLRTQSAAEGLALLECVAAASFGSGKLAAYRAERRTESVLVKTRAGRTLARIYDKGAQHAAPPGRWLRFEAQWRFPRERRPAPASLGPAELRELFARRFAPLWQAAGGFRIAPAASLAERIGAAVADGRLAPSRARTLAGYLLLGGAGVPQGARRTTYELERECRELGLAVSLRADADRQVDVATVLDQCMAPEVWG